MREIRRCLPRLIPLFFLLIGLFAVEGAKTQLMPGATPAMEAETETRPPSPNDVRELMRLLSDPSMVE